MLKKIWMPCVGVTAVIGLSVYNAINSCSFWTLNIANSITAIIAIVFSFYLVQNATDSRKKREIIDDIICQLKDLFSDNDYYVITQSTEPSVLLARIRKVNNALSLLKKLKTKDIKDNDIAYIYSEFEAYSNLVGDHITDMEYLQKSRKELERSIDLISDKLDSVRLDLYGLLNDTKTK